MPLRLRTSLPNQQMINDCEVNRLYLLVAKIVPRVIGGQAFHYNITNILFLRGHGRADLGRQIISSRVNMSEQLKTSFLGIPLYRDNVVQV